MKYKIYLKGGATVCREAADIIFPDNKSKLLKVYIAKGTIDPDVLILASEVAGVIRDPEKPPLATGLIHGAVKRKSPENS